MGTVLTACKHGPEKGCVVEAFEIEEPPVSETKDSSTKQAWSADAEQDQGPPSQETSKSTEYEPSMPPLYESYDEDGEEDAIDFDRPASKRAYTSHEGDDPTSPGTFDRMMTEQSGLSSSSEFGKTSSKRSRRGASKREVGVDIVFRTDGSTGSTRTVRATKKPLGVVFENNTSPIRVKCLREGGHGEKLGVEPGWDLVEVGGEDISELSFVQATQRVGLHLELLPDYNMAVELVFVVNGRQRNAVVSGSPFGITLDNTAPLTVVQVTPKSQAEMCRVRPGWRIKSVAGEDISDCSYDTALGLFQFHVKPLMRHENFQSFLERAAKNTSAAEIEHY